MRIPGFVKLLGLLVLVGLVAGLIWWFFRSVSAVVIFLAGVLVIALVLGALGLMARSRRKKKAQQFGNSLAMQGGAAPASMSQAEELARLDDMRRKFEEGMGRYRSVGKDIYSLPWYMIVGEPGSGKTEAVRRSGISFPPGMQDEFQGVGGTINMNWWFANQAVMLDLAGRLVFEEVVPGKNTEWTEFLKLLSQSRPNCPVNGMLLVIPADSLLRDSPQDIQRKANKLAEQCEVVQRALDIRFPVYVVVTKCDLVSGFRELFDDLNTPAEQGQMLGWSNPNQLDDIFNPKELESHLDVVRQRLHYRRMALLGDPRPQQELSKRRVDEVDALFDFPNSFDKVVPSLQQYLENIFVKSEWSAKPLFLRGIYFTSSMREGEAIDDALAQVLGVAADQLPEGRAWERDRAFFIKDLFVEKIFRESGLVTRATNVQHQSRKRKFTMLAVVAGALIGLIGLTYFAGRSLDKAVKKEHSLWTGIYKSWPAGDAEPKRYIKLVAPTKVGSSTKWEYQGNQRLPRTFGAGATLGDAHKYLHELAEKPPRVPFIFRAFRPLSEGLTTKRRRATRSAFEMSVLHPLTLGAREQLADAEGWDDKATAALRQMLKIECDQQGLEYDPGRGEEQVSLDDLVGYLVRDKEQFEDYDVEDATALAESLEWAYKSGGGKGTWPPVWMPEGGERLKDNPRLQAAAKRFIEDHCARPPSLSDLLDQVARSKALQDQLEAFRDGPLKVYGEAEKEMQDFLSDNLKEMQQLETFHGLGPDWTEDYEALLAAHAKLSEDHQALREIMDRVPLVTTNDLDAAFSNRIAEAVEQAAARFETLNIPFDRRDVKRLRDDLARADDKARDPKEAVEELIRPDVQLLDDFRLAMLVEIEDIEQRYSRGSVLQQLRDIREEFFALQDEIDQRQTRFPLYAPLLLPSELHQEAQTWKPALAKLTNADVPALNRTLDEFCAEVDKRAAAWAEALPETLNPGAIEALRAQTQAGMTDLNKFNVGTRVRNVLKAWDSKFIGDAIEDRARLLGHSVEDLTEQLLVRKTEADQGFFNQFWHNAVLRTVESLKVEAVNARVKEKPFFGKFKAFPLAPPQEGVADLTADQFLSAQESFKRFRTYEDSEEPMSLADGQTADVPDLNEQIAELRTLGLQKFEWERQVFTLLDVLPQNAERRVQAGLEIPHVEAQKDLLRRNGLGNLANDSFLGAWKYLAIGAVGGNNLNTAKWSLYVFEDSEPSDKAPAKIPFPNADLELRFYANPGDVKPDRKILMKGPWGPLRMLHENEGVRDPDDATRWQIRLREKDNLGNERNLWLEYKFDTEKFPHIEEWPGR